MEDSLGVVECLVRSAGMRGNSKKLIIGKDEGELAAVAVGGGAL